MNNRRQILRVVAAVGTASLVRGQDAAQDGAVFRSGVSQVRVDAEVSDAGGQILINLKKEDFRLFDQGQEEPIVSFNFEEEPLDVILLFDIGGDMRSKVLELVRAVELGFHELRRGDRACVMVFSGVSAELLPFTADLGAVNDAILLKVIKQHFGGASKVAEAADDAALRFRTESSTQRRRAVLIVTEKTASHQSAEITAVHDLWKSDAVASELILAKTSPPMDAVVEKTGGAAIAAGIDPGTGFQESLRRLRRRYALYYGLPAGVVAGSERSIRVELTAEAARRFPGARIFARAGYIP
jgi:hypothetical protein